MRGCILVILSFLLVSIFGKNGNVQTTYHWHLQQPIYWPAPIPTDSKTYQKAWQSMQLKDKQGGHPESNLADIFSKADRVAVYQSRAADSINTCAQYADMGAQISYSGCLIENVNSLADQNWNGYNPGWNKTYGAERQRKTSGGFSKMDLVSFTYHHALAPLIDRNAFKKEIEIHKVIYGKTWGPSPGYSKGFFPAEMSFSERMIPTLVEQGIEWVIVSNNHISRSCQNYPYDPHGDNNNPPNRADQINPPQSNWFNISISRGCTPHNAYPYSFRPHYAKHVDPQSGKEYKIVVVPSAQGMSWQDGYECYGTSDIEKIAPKNDPNHPMLIVFAHDGDNAFGGGYSYYMQCVPQFVQQAVNKGYNPTTIQQYLNDFPVDEDDIVHVEDGAWVNADGDFGAPRFINWNWPLTGNGTDNYDPVNGWQVNERNWAVITAAENFVETAEQMSGGVRIEEVQQPSSSSTPAERAWHFFLPALTSGYMYYGAILDMPIKQTISCNQAVALAKQAINATSQKDTTSPSIWYVMRQPYNPGGYGMGSLYSYQYKKMPNDFWIYSFVFDVSGVKEVTLNIRQDSDGINPIEDNANEVYDPEILKLKGVGPWQKYSMTKRIFPKGDHSGIHFEVLPDEIADEYFFHVQGKKNVLLDYFISAVDIYGNEKKSDIYHVWVGDNSKQTTLIVF